MKEYDQTRVVDNYYKANNALMEIAITPGIPQKLKQLVIKASSETMKIIDFVNEENRNAQQ